MIRITKAAVTVYGLLFALLGALFWAAPDLIAERFAVRPLGGAGLSTLRGDFGGFFLILSALCLAGAWLRRRGPLIVAALTLTVVIVGRLISWVATGDPAGLGANLPIEIVGVLVLALHLWAMGRLQGEPTGRPARDLAIVAGGVALLAALVVIALQLPTVQDRLFARATEQRMSGSQAALMADDALRVAICGSSAPLPSPGRAKACVAVIAGGKIYIVDSGPESTKNLMMWGLPLERIGGAFITHFHSDHIGDLGELNLQTWVAGRAAQMDVYGGPGVERLVAGFNEAYAQDEVYRTAHHTAKILPPETGTMVARPIAMPTGAPRAAVILDDGAMKITAIETNHAPVAPAYAYRFDYKGRSVVITGDTTAYTPLIAASRGADILVSEAMNREMVRTLEGAAKATGRPRVSHIMADIQSYHISPTEAADLANKAQVKLLVFYHLIPTPDNALLERIFTRGVERARRGGWDLSEDGSLYTLPLGSSDYEIGRIAD